MKFTSSIIALALALCSSVSATPAAFGSSTGSLAIASGTANPSASVPLTVSLVQSSPHSVFGYISFTGGSAAAYNYSYNFNGTVDTANVAVLAAAGTTPQYARGLLYCSLAACNSNVSTSAAYDYIYTSLNGTFISASNTVAYNATAITDTNILLSATPIGLNTPTVDNLNQQPGKFLYFTVPSVPSGTTGNATYALLTFVQSSANPNPFAGVYVVGGAKCPRPTTNDGITRTSFSMTSNTTIAGTLNITNLTTGTFWVWMPLLTSSTTNALTSSDTAAITVQAFGTATCTAGTNGFCSSAATLKTVGAAFAGVMAAAFMLF